MQLPSISSHQNSLRFFSNSAVNVHDSQAYRKVFKMEAHNFYLWSKSYIVNSSHRLQFLRAAVVCAIFERISVLSRHLRQTISLMCLKFNTIPGFCLFTLPCNLICITKDRPMIWVFWPLGCVVRFLCAEWSLNLHCHHKFRNCIALSNILFIRVELVFCYTFLKTCLDINRPTPLRWS